MFFLLLLRLSLVLLQGHRISLVKLILGRIHIILVVSIAYIQKLDELYNFSRNVSKGLQFFSRYVSICILMFASDW